MNLCARFGWFLLGLGLLAGCRQAGTPGADRTNVYDRLEALIAHEMADKALPEVGIVVVDGDQLWQRRYREGRRDTAEAVYRVASLTKLFTTLAALRLVEEGRLDLDAPVTTYLPDFQPENPFAEQGGPVTLRQLLGHRAGLLREPPAGSYFDATPPPLADVVTSLNETALVAPPGAVTKYSNAGFSVVGRVIEAVTEQPYAAYVEEAVLAPLGLTHAAFDLPDSLRAAVPPAEMWTYDPRTFPAPTFELGIEPAAGLYASLGDLGRFMQSLYDGTAPVSAEALEAAWTVQEPESASGFGLGFYVSAQGGARRVQHSGQHYGFASRLYVLPGEELGVAVVATADAANSVVDRIGAYALALLQAERAGRPLPDFPRTAPVPQEQAAFLAGRYTAGDVTLELDARPDGLYLFNGAGWLRLRRLGDDLIVDDRRAYGFTLRPELDGLRAGETLYRRTEAAAPPLPEPEVAALLGGYGPDHNTLYVLERDGQLWLLIEWFHYYPLQQVEGDRYVLPRGGLYAGEPVTFERDAEGRATRVTVGGVPFERRPEQADGATFRIVPQHAPDELRAMAQAVSPPEENGTFRTPDLVELTELDSTLRLDVRYASDNNFMGMPFYQEPRVFLQRVAAEALVRVQEDLRRHGLGLIVYDGYRPWYVTKMFWDATPEYQRTYVATPSNGSRHNRGAAVDVGLVDLETGAVIDMPSGYDEFTPRAHVTYPGGTARSRHYRDLLRQTMMRHGFGLYEAEWWHFDHADWRTYPILNEPFEAL